MTLSPDVQDALALDGADVAAVVFRAEWLFANTLRVEKSETLVKVIRDVLKEDGLYRISAGYWTRIPREGR